MYVGSADFTWGPDTYIQCRFERHQADIAVVERIDMPVWGSLTERGSVLGVVQTTFEGPVTAESQENATAQVRYDPALAIGSMLTDDLEREWSISGSRTLAWAPVPGI